MRNIIAISRREILSFFVSPIAYFVITGFVLLAGYFFFNYLGIFNLYAVRYGAMGMRYGAQAPNLNQFVIEPFYHTLILILVFVIPLLTMRSLAEEKRRGTFELLITSPISVTEIVLGKFCGIAFVLLVMVAAIFCFPLLLLTFGQPGPEVWPAINGILAVLLCALSFGSVALAASSFTENQLVAAISGVVTLLLLYIIHAPAESWGGVGGKVLEYLSPVMQVQDMIRGVLNLQALVYFLSLLILGLFLSQKAVEARRWR